MRKSGPRRCSSASSKPEVAIDDWHDRGFAKDWDEADNLVTNPDRPRQLSLLADLLAASGATHVIDLGIGSAQVESVINRRHADFFGQCRFTGIDASEAMLDLAGRRCQAESLNAVRLMRADFSSINRVDSIDPPDAVICVQALHEVTHAVKRSVFAWVNRQLPEGRPFYILDRFEYPADAWLEDWRATWDWMRPQVAAEVLEFDEYHRRYCAKTDYIASVEDYCDWLGEAGFATQCAYRCFNRALIVARARPA